MRILLLPRIVLRINIYKIWLYKIKRIWILIKNDVAKTTSICLKFIITFMESLLRPSLRTQINLFISNKSELHCAK